MSGISPRERLAQALGKVRNRLELPVKAGVSSRYVGNAVLGIPVPTVPYLRLCMAIGLDPAPGRILIIPRPSNFDFDFFALGFTLAAASSVTTSKWLRQFSACGLPQLRH